MGAHRLYYRIESFEVAETKEKDDERPTWPISNAGKTSEPPLMAIVRPFSILCQRM
jgi:hypothetical protein